MRSACACRTVRRCSALSFFITVYRTMAEWRAVIERLTGFDQAVATARAAASTPPVITIASVEANAVTLNALSVRLPNGASLLSADQLSVQPGDKVLVSGPSGAGKSTL